MSCFKEGNSVFYYTQTCTTNLYLCQRPSKQWYIAVIASNDFMKNNQQTDGLMYIPVIINGCMNENKTERKKKQYMYTQSE